MRFVHYSANPDLSLDRLYSVEQFPVEHKGHLHSKPQGLWLSDDDEEDNWKVWCEAEIFNLDKLTNAYAVSLDLSNVLHIDNNLDLLKVHNKYRSGYRLFNFIDWQRMAKDYQGIIISPYQWDVRYSEEVEWYYGWDVACACIWDMSAISSFEKVNG